MNAPATDLRLPHRVGLVADDFLMLRERGAFAGFCRAELLEGELWGIPLGADGEIPESDASVPMPLTVADYALLNSAGSLAGLPKTELIEGVLYRMSPQYRRHGYVKDELAYRLRRALEEIGSDLHVATEQSVRLDDHNEPQPDIVLTREPRGDGPIPLESVALVIEVSVTTLDFDLGEKEPLYARSGIPEYWVIDLNENRALMHEFPEADGYRGQLDILLGEALHASSIEGLSVATDGLLD
jgi:Uma2 family endonuclease